MATKQTPRLARKRPRHGLQRGEALELGLLELLKTHVPEDQA
jgi:hypothetical protein